MDMKAIKRFEYEEQLFEYSSQFFADCFKNFVSTELNTSIDVLANSFKNKLVKESKNPDQFILKVKEMKEKLKAEYNKCLNAEFESAKEKISKFMDIPKHVLLKEDLTAREGSSEDISEIDREIDFLNSKYKAMCYLKMKLQKEIDMAEYTIFTLNSINDKNDIDFNVVDTNEFMSLKQSNLDLVK